MACCRQAMWARGPGLSDPLLVRMSACAGGSRDVKFAFSFSVAAIISLWMLPPSPESRTVASVAPFQWKCHHTRGAVVVAALSSHTIAGPVAHVTRTVCVAGCTASSQSGSLGPSQQRITPHKGYPCCPCAVWNSQVKGTSPSLTCGGGGWAGRWLGQASEKGDMLPPICADHVSVHGTSLYRMHRQPRLQLVCVFDLRGPGKLNSSSHDAASRPEEERMRG